MKVSEIMTSPAITVTARHSLKGALIVMRENNLRRTPVVQDGELVGMIVQHDIEKALQRPGTIPETPVEWVMTKKPLYSVSPDDDIVEAARIMKDFKISSLPVISNGNVEGIISETDILGLFIELMRNK
ncbi:MAG: CBS domain-containing protein [Chitinophagales bacterium]